MIELRSRLTSAALTWLALCAPAASAPFIHHALSVHLEPASHRLEARDRITLPEGAYALRDGSLRFALYAELEVRAPDPAWRLRPLAAPDLAAFGAADLEASVPLREYALEPTGPPLAPGPLELVLELSGAIAHELEAEGEEYARSFSRTPGIIDERGVVLAGSSWWVPWFGPDLSSFELEVDLPEGWNAVSQGARTHHVLEAGRQHVTWSSPDPMDEIYLIAGRFTETSRPAGAVTAFAFLREPDPTLAGKYLEATAQYIDMYSELIGPYPYQKFALVENFWETGYGMPSFTLLGPKVIRFPFILHSSYPHEILHNWWGNSVFVDPEGGNWCEGLTAYLADHLIKEGRGEGALYRRDSLKRYRDYVRGARDFPLRSFRERHSSATEAVGYGKGLMLWHMLRLELGDETFARGLRKIYTERRATRASFADLAAAFSSVAGRELGPFFAQWLDRIGAPELALGEVTVTGAAGAYRLAVDVRQVQSGPAYALSVPIAVTSAGEPVARVASLALNAATGRLELELPNAPLEVAVDPAFDLFRRLDLSETPPALGQLFGADRVLILLPREEDAFAAAAWTELAEAWSRDSGDAVMIARDDTIASLPPDRSVWVLGDKNRWAPSVKDALRRYTATLGADGARWSANEPLIAADERAFVAVVAHPASDELALGLITSTRADALPGLARKLPHYGKYSYLGFEGAEPTNMSKGQWPAVGSPLVRRLTPDSVPPLTLPPREPLARPREVFDEARLVAHVRDLSAPELEGRGVGSEGLGRAAEAIAKAFRDAGLEPGGETDGSYFQTWSEPGGPYSRPVELRNVIGVLKGKRRGWERQSVVIGAHYDHLGYGWPEARQGAEGVLHPGADDNASGVAVLLELARLMASSLEPERSIVFVAFTAEEWGLRGSRHYVASMQKWPAREAIGMLSLDTVGRLEGRDILLFGGASATEWIHIARGIGFTTGVAAKLIEEPGASDQQSFLEAGVPALQVFSGANADYHRPSDTADKIDAAGLVKVAVFTREAAVYLSERAEPLTSTLSARGAAAADAPPADQPARRVSLGTLPDFSYPGPGVRIEQVTPGSPAALAGLAAGDLLMAIDGQPLEGLKAFADALRVRAAGDIVALGIKRGDTTLELKATLVAR